MQVNWRVLHPASLYEIKSDETRGYADGERREVLSADKLKLYDRARPSGNDTRVPTMVGTGRRGLAAKDARHLPEAEKSRRHLTIQS